MRKLSFWFGGIGAEKPRGQERDMSFQKKCRKPPESSFISRSQRKQPLRALRGTPNMRDFLSPLLLDLSESDLSQSRYLLVSKKKGPSLLWPQFDS